MRNLRNIKIVQVRESYPFTPVTGGGGERKIPPRDSRYNHADYLQKQFEISWKSGEEENKKVASISNRNGIYLEFRGKKEYELVTKSLENVSQNVRLCNVKEIEGTKHATVFVPSNKKEFFLEKINGYKEKESNKDVIESIESINIAVVDALWTDKRKIPIDKLEGCEVWLSVYKKETHKEIANEFFQLCDKLEIGYSSGYIKFPERVVVAIKGNRKILTKLLLNSAHIAEFRKTSTPSSFYIEDNDRIEQKGWIEDLLNRVTFNRESNISICLLDKGISNGHPLIKPVLEDKDMHTTFNDGIVQDISGDGHGTGMAGIATYFNLEELLDGNDYLEINHKLESVRIIDDRIVNDSKLYGAITSEAISLVEITNPDEKRIIAMAITAGFDMDADEKDKTKFKGDGKPTSWSGAIDNLALGNYGVEESFPRLIIISAGNTSESEIENAGDYEVAVALHSVEDPAQSWNALTIGAYTEKAFLSGDNSIDNFKPLVEPGSYSPFNSSSLMWSDKWPVKPDIVLEGGNIGYYEESRDIKYSLFDHLSLLTANNKYHRGDYFTTMAMTSPATAQAANMAAKIVESYPDIWPETIRALMVHSAEWTGSMIRQVFKDKKIEEVSKTEKRQLLRLVGYGVPNLDKALYSARNSVNLVVEDEIQPFKKKESSVTINEMSLHEIPWPKDVLIGLGETPVKMRVTLSYFIDPSPGEIGWEDKYRYPGCRLYFDVNNTNEDKEKFLLRINKKMRDEEYNKTKTTRDTSGRWFLGVNNRNVGSIHSDIWEDTAANLAENRFLAVYPGGGWWKERVGLGKYNSKVRYSLIVSLSTPDQSIDLYTPIMNIVTRISNKRAIDTKVKYKNNEINRK
ncbi:MAG TPA: S8 family peptidase [Syntrophomonadaceae bacterium]|nr:S8 family peptidase [Syntrophomonadaceae bacterium]